ncbi:hypothetical protein PF005_g4433 [Phytophthora fragariae]|uniref:Uncharacterized protein n=2 Tax=Phytophthora TaxID=4783 RepID=A0A6A3LX80_9STRA|nr:hypothetical protein PF003_g5329 [Phytophthora fragariae]KAE9043927.1 hypothetical protein PR002_g3093 [Phytophthora rubi]KAE8945704.1 hypothetical protein PF009_g4666 [Phytophthora fragariae]KAE9024371.1 hypothetical protein PF011_g3548 [Phytophthora fragariae]KAE9049659.1 hypothetical protein PR001_g3114 [Phytophthora rubi]
MPLSISFYHNKRGENVASSYQSVALHDREKVKHKMALPCEFYRNIWGPTEEEDAALRRRARSSKFSSSPASVTSRKFKKRLATGPLVDIAQVAHVVTTMSDFRADYGEDSKRVRLVNIWDDRSLALGLEPESSSEKSSRSSGGSDQGPSTADTEPEEIMSPISRADRITELSCEDSDDDLSSLASSVMNQRPGQLKRTKTPEIVFPTTKKSTIGGRGNGNTKPDKKEMNLMSLPVPPPSSHNGSIIFSAVFSEQTDWSWSAKFLLGIHEPIRHALFVMDRFLEQSQTRSKPEASQTLALETHVAEFFLWFKAYFVEYLQCQHEVKASVLLPLLNLPVTTKQQILDVYQDISQMLTQIQQLERALCVSGACSASSWLLRLQVLQTEIRQLNRTLHAALNMEETTLHAAMSAAFTERAFRTHIMPRVFRAIRAKRVVVPWIVERSKIWGGDVEQRSIQGMLPFSAKFMYRKIWRPYFMSNVAVAMKNLNEFVSAADSNSSGSIYSERHGEMCTVM